MNTNLDQTYWNDRHNNNDTPWEIGTVSPAIKAYIDQWKDKKSRVLIPGAGHHHEAAYLLQCGFEDITICDISPIAISNMKTHLPVSSHITYNVGDFFDLDRSYDLILEQTFFCALDPTLRNHYVDKMTALLTKNGTLAGLLFATHFDKDGPPFGGTIEEYKALFDKKLHILSIDMCYNSIAPRSSNELFFICKKYK
jgi:hypothetical protein